MSPVEKRRHVGHEDVGRQLFADTKFTGDFRSFSLAMGEKSFYYHYNDSQ